MRIDAVLQGNDRRRGPDHRLDGLARAFDIPQLHAEQHIVDLAHRRGIVGGLGRLQVGVAALALDPEAMVLHGGEMCATRDERDLRSSMGKGSAKATSNATGADYCNPHRKSSRCPGLVTRGPYSRSRARSPPNVEGSRYESQSSVRHAGSAGPGIGGECTGRWPITEISQQWLRGRTQVR